MNHPLGCMPNWSIPAFEYREHLINLHYLHYLILPYNTLHYPTLPYITLHYLHSMLYVYRPALISLDLSYNLLSDLEATIQVLVEVSTLRNLLLMGNPLSVSTHILVGENCESLSSKLL